MSNPSIKAVCLGGPDNGLPDKGEQNAVLMIHGFGADRLSWTATAPALFSEYQVWALDLPGHGSSWQSAPASTLDGICDQLMPELVHIASDKPLHLIGHSLGGALCLLLAQRCPQQVASLSLLAPAGLGAGVNTAFMQEFQQLQDVDQALATLNKLVHNPKLMSSQLAAILIKQLQKDGIREALQITNIALSNAQPLLPTLSNFADRSMIIWGLQDSINPYLISDQKNTTALWHTIDACGHLPHIEHRVSVNNLISEFLHQHSAT